MECWRRVIEIAPDFKGALKEIGDSLFDLKRFGEAAQAYDSELTLNPLDAECRSKKDIALKRLARSQQDVSEHVQAADWNRPTIILTIGHWWTEPYSPPYAHMKFFNFVCHIQNISDRAQRLGKETTVFHRSKATGEMSPMADAVLLEITLPLQLAPQSACDQVVLELWPFPKEKSDDDCVREMFSDSEETIAYDEEFGTVVLLQSAQNEQRHEVSTESAFMVVYDSNRSWHVVKEEEVQWELEGTDINANERRRPLELQGGIWPNKM